MAAPATSSAPSWRDLFAEGRAPRLALIALGVWLNAADALVTSTVMPTVGRDLGGYAYFSWATAAYMVGAIFSGATATRLSAAFGLRRAVIAAALVTASGCALSAVAPSMVVLVIGRAVQGLGGGWIVGACFAAIGAMFPQRHLARVFGLVTGVWGVATVLGPLVGAAFAQGAQWRWLFWFFGGQCLVFVVAAWLLLPRSARPPAQRTPWAQVALVLVGVALLGAADLAASAWLAGGLGVAAVAAFVGAVRRRAGPHGLFPRAAGDPSTLTGAAYLSVFALMAAAMSFNVYAPALLQTLHGFSPMAAGYAAGLDSVGWTVSALLVAGLRPRWQPAVIRLGGGCVTVSLAWLALAMRAGPVWEILAAAALLGVGFGLTSGFVARRVIAVAAEHEREVASAGVNSVGQIGNAAGACLAGIVANLLGMAEGVTTAAAQASAVWLFALGVPVALVGWIACWRVAAERVPEA